MSKDQIIKLVIDSVKKNNVLPTWADLAKVGISRAKIRHSFGNLETLFKLATERAPNVIFDINSDIKPLSIKKKSKVFIITTAITGAKVNKKFLASIKQFTKVNKAELLISVATLSTATTLDPVLASENIVSEDTYINNNISILGLKSPSKKTDPITGLPRIGQRNGSVIIPSPKQRLKYVATGPSALPHALLSTGAITDPNYIKSNKFIASSDYVANYDHIIGALIVEIEDDKFFHFRHIQASEDGSFSDLNTKYYPNKIKKINVPILVLGDWHSGETCPIVATQTQILAKKLKVDTLVMHDVFSATSCSHHDEGKYITKAAKAELNKLNLKEELDIYSNDLDMLTKNHNVVLVKSNHDEHLEKYLNEGRYVEDSMNHRLALDLAAAMLDGKPPLQYYFEKKYNSKKITWLERDEYYAFKGVHLSAHGDKGANGTRGGINSLENAYGKVVFGHSHTPEIMRGAYCVGTSTATKPDYGSGPSSWLNTHCIVHQDGSRQLVNMINGKFTCML